MCSRNNIFQVWCDEYIDELKNEIKKLVGDDLVLEVCAGDGMLTHWLKEKGVNIIATDNMSWHNKDKRPIKLYGQAIAIDAIDAIKKFKPRLIIASWVEYGSTLDVDILKENPEFFINIGERYGGCTGSELLWESYDKRGYASKELENVDKYNLCRTDDALGVRHSSTTLFFVDTKRS